MSASIAYKHYIRALSRWPKDALRPECQFQDAMRRRIDRRFLPASNTTQIPETTSKAVANSAVDEKLELEQANALYSLLENRYKKTYPIQGSLMNPESSPTHFEDLMRELEAVPERSWWSTQTNKWKGFLRWQ